MFLSPAEIPLIVAEIARFTSGVSSPARFRRSISTWIKCIGSTYGFRNLIECASTRFVSSNSFCYRNRQHRAHCAMKLAFEHVEDPLAQFRIRHQFRVQPRRSQIHLAQRHLHVAQQIDKQRKLPRHLLQQIQ